MPYPSFMAEPEQKPERVAKDRERHAEMGGKPVLADVDAIDQPALHHVPAERTLQAAENEQAKKPGQERARDIADGPEDGEWDEEDDADEAAEKAMGPLPPEDCFELTEAHALVELAILGNLLIGGERLLPVGLH